MKTKIILIIFTGFILIISGCALFDSAGNLQVSFTGGEDAAKAGAEVLIVVPQIYFSQDSLNWVQLPKPVNDTIRIEAGEGMPMTEVYEEAQSIDMEDFEYIKIVLGGVVVKVNDIVVNTPDEASKTIIVKTGTPIALEEDEMNEILVNMKMNEWFDGQELVLDKIGENATVSEL